MGCADAYELGEVLFEWLKVFEWGTQNYRTHAMSDKTYLWLYLLQIYLFDYALNFLRHFLSHSLYILTHIFIVWLQHKSLYSLVREFNHMYQKGQIDG